MKEPNAVNLKFYGAQGCLPIVVGITGHRNLLDERLIYDLMVAQLRELVEFYPMTPINALSPLAEGADRIFAQAALDVGLELEVILPFVHEHYENDFPTSIEEFRALCSRARRVRVLPPLLGATTLDQDSDGTVRKLMYAQVGIYVSQVAQILIAVSDGTESREIGGTSQILHYRRHGELFHLLGADDSVNVLPLLFGQAELQSGAVAAIGATQVIRVCRANAASKNIEGFAPSILPPDEIEQRRRQDTHAALQKLDSYNREVRAAAQRNPEELTLHTSTSSIAKSPIFDNRFLASDAQANLLGQSTRQGVNILFFWLGALLFLHVWYLEAGKQSFVLAVYLSAYLGLLTVAYRDRLTAKNQQAADCRVLSEALRIQCIWNAIQLDRSVAHSYDLRDAAGIGWVRFALTGAVLSDADPCPDAKMVVLKEWIDPQLHYLRKKRDDRERHATLINRSATAALLVSMAAASALLGNAWLSSTIAFSDAMTESLTAALAFLPGVAALLAGYVEFGEYEREIREFDIAIERFEMAKSAVKRSATLLEVHGIATDLGKGALRETAHWALLHKVRKFKTTA